MSEHTARARPAGALRMRVLNTWVGRWLRYGMLEEPPHQPRDTGMVPVTSLAHFVTLQRRHRLFYVRPTWGAWEALSIARTWSGYRVWNACSPGRGFIPYRKLPKSALARLIRKRRLFVPPTHFHNTNHRRTKP